VIFEKATRKRLRFETAQGRLDVEAVWRLSLPSLDLLAKDLNSKLKLEQEESFIKPATTTSNELSLKFEIVKYIIATKLKEDEERKLAGTKAILKSKLLEALANKQDAALNESSVEDLEKRLADLD